MNLEMEMEVTNISGEHVSLNATINEYTLMVNISKNELFSHWSNFPPPPSEHYYIMGFFITLISIFGTISNGFVLFLFAR